LFELLGEYCDKDPKQVLEDSNRDKWLSAKEALDYGIIDEVIGLK
jgi:ATP-dependent Clp protease protease subunit